MANRVRVMPHYANDSGWYASLPAPAVTASLIGRVKADALILGAGFAGLSAAHRLAELRPDWHIVIVDALAVGMASSGRNSGFMIDLPHTLDSDSYSRDVDFDRRIIAFNRSAIDYSRTLVKQYGIDCDWSETGKIHAAATPQGALSHSAFMRGLDVLEEDYTLLNAQQMQAITGINYYHSGVYTPGTVAVQPAAFVRGLAAHLPANVTLYENTPIQTYSFGQPNCLTSAAGEISASQVLICNNGFGAMFGLYKHSLLPLLLFASMTEPMNDAQQQALGGERQWGLVPSHPAGATIKRTADQRLIVRTGIRAGHQYRYNDATITRMKNMHRKSYMRRFGKPLPDLRFAYTWGGLLCMSRNEGSVFGQVHKGVHAAICQNGLGVARGMASGKLLAEHVAGVDSVLLRHQLAAAKPAWMPPKPISTMGVVANIWRHQLRAGAEA